MFLGSAEPAAIDPVTRPVIRPNPRPVVGPEAAAAGASATAPAVPTALRRFREAGRIRRVHDSLGDTSARQYFEYTTAFSDAEELYSKKSTRITGKPLARLVKMTRKALTAIRDIFGEGEIIMPSQYQRAATRLRTWTNEVERIGRVRRPTKPGRRRGSRRRY